MRSELWWTMKIVVIMADSSGCVKLSYHLPDGSVGMFCRCGDQLQRLCRETDDVFPQNFVKDTSSEINSTSEGQAQQQTHPSKNGGKFEEKTTCC